MNADLIEQKILKAIDTFAGLLPAEQLEDMRGLVIAGEPGIALENLCTQIYEYDVVVQPDVYTTIAEAGAAMGSDSKYWERIATGK
ncbi:MAG TPA: MafI family immunity protein [Candidatus Saccharimonadales bacterium]|nr:MafI family immunity protein [Candidatus Saccharimonadales bacterium]